MAYLKPGAEPPKKGKGAKITDKMQAFVDHYIISLNGAEAVRGAGYSVKSKNAKRIATELLRHPLVKAEIKIALDKRKERMELTSDYVLTKLMAIVEDQKEGNPNAALRGLELLGKHLGLYKDRQEISGPDGEAIKMEQKVKEDVADFTSRLSSLAKRQGSGRVVELLKRGGEG